MIENFIFCGVLSDSEGKVQFSINYWYSDSIVLGTSVKTLTDGWVDILLYYTQ